MTDCVASGCCLDRLPYTFASRVNRYDIATFFPVEPLGFL